MVGAKGGKFYHHLPVKEMPVFSGGQCITCQIHVNYLSKNQLWSHLLRRSHAADKHKQQLPAGELIKSSCLSLLEVAPGDTKY